MIKDIGGRISMSPPLEMAMAHGYPAVQDALDRGIRPSLIVRPRHHGRRRIASG